MNQLHERATPIAIRKNIVSCWAKLPMLEKEIYSLTTQNKTERFKNWGANEK